MEKVIPPSNASQHNEYERLKTLYSISKKLSTFKNIDESFADIVSSAAESFPLLSAVLIEHWEKKPKTAVWFSAEATKHSVAQAILNAKTSYSYLSGASNLETADFLNDFSCETELSRSDKTRAPGDLNSHNYIVLPLMIDNLPPLGALQLEGSTPLDERDLEFVSALTNLVSVALDRYYKAKKERMFALAENKINRETIAKNKTTVNELVLERALREDFVSLLTHDLKSPLSVIMGAAELICKRKDVPEPCAKLGEMIVRKSKHVVNMINNLLDANQIRSGRKLTLSLEAINLNSLVIDTISEMRLVHGERFVFVSNHQIEITCDINGVKRILENLTNNAVKYGSQGTPVTIILEESKDDIYLKVHNSGPVISAEDQKSIFEQFHRTSDAQQGPREGWGIGLTLVRGVAEAHGGSVAVESSLESGTTFIVKLPKDPSLLN